MIDFNKYFTYHSDGFVTWKIDLGKKVKAGSKAGTHHKKSGYWYVTVDQTKYKLHRVIYAMHHGYLPDMVDHIDNDSLNNRIENLRPATKQSNAWNSKLRSDNKTGVKGVTRTANGRYRARVKDINRTYLHVGYFASAEEAKSALQHIRQNLHGEFSRDE